MAKMIPEAPQTDLAGFAVAARAEQLGHRDNCGFAAFTFANDNEMQPRRIFFKSCRHGNLASDFNLFDCYRVLDAAHGRESNPARFRLCGPLDLRPKF